MTLKARLRGNTALAVNDTSPLPRVSNTPGFVSSIPTGERPLVVREARAAWMLGVAPRTLQDMRLRGDGPPYVALTERSVGYLVSALEAWALERSRHSTSAATRNRGARA